MKYFQEMDTKWGFEDGNCVPPDAEKCREVYIKVLNKLLEKNGSDCRIIEFDRPGVHNWCLWLRVWKENLNSHEEHPVDDAWTKSVDEANEMGLDEFVETECFIREEELETFLKEQLCPIA